VNKQMVTLRFSKMAIQEIKLWGASYKNMQEETGVKWDEQQERILNILRRGETMSNLKIEILIDGKKENEFVMKDKEDYALPDVHAFVEHIKGWLFDRIMKS
jgi:hypothetical protein